MMRIGWFTTARGPGSYNLFTTMMRRLRCGDIDARLAFVFINREVKGNEYRKRIIEMAEAEGIPVIILPSDGFQPELKARDIEAWRAEYGKALRERISKHPMDFGALAGYMLIIDPETCRRYDLINLHPALPDTYKGTWEEIVARVVDNHDEEYGSTIHVCSPELDRGPVIAFDRFEVGPLRSPHGSKEELVKAVRAEQLRREAPLLMETIQSIVRGEIRLRHGAVIRPGDGQADLDLSEKVTAALERDL
jgi:phosphoribosylglycinamide formyltransferase-1